MSHLARFVLKINANTSASTKFFMELLTRKKEEFRLECSHTVKVTFTYDAIYINVIFPLPAFFQ